MNESAPKARIPKFNELLSPTECLQADFERVVNEARKRADKVIDALLERQRKDAELAAGCYTHDYGDN